MTAASDSASTSVGREAGELVMTRVLDAPREAVFRAWTEPEHFARWFGPAGSTIPVLTMDARPGGVLHFCHRFTDHDDVWVAGVYREVRAPERIVFTCHFSDPSGARVDRPDFPLETTISVALADEGGRTRMTIRQAGLDRDRGEVGGWTEGLDRLAALLAGG